MARDLKWGMAVADILIDARDKAVLSEGSWYVDSLGYVAGEYRGQRTRLHRVIAKAKKGQCVDHINRNKLDNRRVNLRIATHAENLRNTKFRSNNTSGYRGVYLCKVTGRWRAQIRAEDRTRQLGRFRTAVAAARVYDLAARQLHGEFAVLNGV